VDEFIGVEAPKIGKSYGNHMENMSSFLGFEFKNLNSGENGSFIGIPWEFEAPKMGFLVVVFSGILHLDSGNFTSKQWRNVGRGFHNKALASHESTSVTWDEPPPLSIHIDMDDMDHLDPAIIYIYICVCVCIIYHIYI
jgi:hypothetical protein